ncbi:hypothetical protein KI387_031597, partial [Taxus chinensis]
GCAHSSYFDDPCAYSKDIDIPNDEASVLRHGYAVDLRLHAKNNAPMDDFMHGDTSGLWNFDGFLSPSVLAGDFLELKDLMPPL